MMAGFSLGPRYLFRWCVITRRGRISGSAHARYYEVHDPYRSRQLVVVFNRPKLPSNKLARTLFSATVNLLQNDHREVSGFPASPAAMSWFWSQITAPPIIRRVAIPRCAMTGILFWSAAFFLSLGIFLPVHGHTGSADGVHLDRQPDRDCHRRRGGVLVPPFVQPAA